MPAITALMSVYNGARWLDECISSVLKQSFIDFEFLIIDDGSTDNSLEVIKRYEKQDQRIKIITQENIGLTKSLAKGVSLSNGDWIARIDCDDLCEKDRFKEQYEYAKKNNFQLVGSFSREITTDDKLGKIIKCPITHKKLSRNLLRQKQFFSHSSSFFLKKYALEIGNYRESLATSQDYDLWLRFSEKYIIGCLPKVKVLIRNHSSRISNKNRGITQKVDAYLALVSYKIRKKNKFIDPLNSKFNEGRNIYFKKFVFEKLFIYNHLKYFEKKYEFESLNLKKKNNIFKFIYILFNFLKVFNTFDMQYILLRRKLLGSFISNKILQDWIDYLSKK